MGRRPKTYNGIYRHGRWRQAASCSHWCYVGAIAGGGVIFRNMDKSGKSSWRAGTGDKSRGLGKGNFDLYNNPYVGRVIDGYAFSEGCKVENGNANYQINELTKKGTPCVTTTAPTTSTSALTPRLL